MGETLTSYHLGRSFNDRLSIEGSSMILKLTFVHWQPAMMVVHLDRSDFFVQKYALRKLDVFYSFKIILNFFEVCCCFSKICFKEKFHHTLLICVGIRFSWMKDLKYFWNFLTWMAVKIYDSSRCGYTFFSGKRNGCDGRCMFINIKEEVLSL